MRINLPSKFIKLLALAAGAAIMGLAQTPANWFNITNGDTNCHAHLLSPTGYAFYFVCSNPRGGFEGTYTPATANTATDVITFGISAGAGNTGNNVCLLAINVTANPVTIGSFGTLPAQFVAFQCDGSAGGIGTAPLTPPPPSPQTKKKVSKK